MDFANLIQLRILRWGDYTGAKYNHKGPYKMVARWSESEGAMCDNGNRGWSDVVPQNAGSL